MADTTAPDITGTSHYCSVCMRCTDQPCQIHSPNPKVTYGWTCPRCQTVHAPWVPKCHCPIPTFTSADNVTEETEPG